MSGTCQVHGQLHVRYLSGSCHPHVRSMSGTRTPPCQVHILSLPFTNPLYFLGGTKCPRSIGRDKVPSNQEFVSLCKGYVRSMSGTCTPPVRSRSLISGSPNGSKSIDFEPIWAGFTQNDMICSQIGLKKVKKVKRVKKVKKVKKVKRVKKVWPAARK